MSQNHATHTQRRFSCLECCRDIPGAVEAWELSRREAAAAPQLTPEQRDRLAVLLRER